MARVHFVKAARASKRSRKCMRCGHEIAVGASYKHASLKTGPYTSLTRVWCHQHFPRASELTVNEVLTQMYSLQEGIEDDADLIAKAPTIVQATAALEIVKGTMESAADEADSVADEIEDRINNLPENFQQGSQADEMQERADACREWGDALRSAAQQLPDEVTPGEDDDDDDDRESIISDIQGAVGELGL